MGLELTTGRYPPMSDALPTALHRLYIITFTFRVRLTIMLVFLSILLGVLIVPKNSLLIYH